MDLVQVEPLRSETTKRCLDPHADVTTRRAEVVHAVAGGEAHLRGEHDVVTPTLQRAPGDLLRLALGVHVGRVDEVAARFEEAVDELATRRLVGFASERHRSEAQLRDPDPRAAQLPVLHD
jgi:hypothetical protein